MHEHEAKIYVCFRPFYEGGAGQDECPSDFLECVWQSKQNIIDHLLELVKGRKYSKNYKNIVHEAVEYKDQIFINAYGDLVEGYSTGTKKRVHSLLDTLYIIQEIKLNQPIEDNDYDDE